MDWVEKGKAPAQIVGAHMESGKTHAPARFARIRK